MCIICVEYEKDKLTITEAYRALHEMRKDLSEEHVQEIMIKLDADWWIQWLENMPQTD